MADPKMVPESDLIALKASHKTALEEIGTTHTGEITTLTEEHTGKVAGFQSQIKTGQDELSRQRATIGELEDRVNGNTSSADDIKALKVELKSATDSLKSSQETLATDLRTRLTGDFKIPEKALEGKTVSELTVIRDALAATRTPESKNYTAGGGSGVDPPTKPRDKIKQGLEAGDLKPR